MNDIIDSVLIWNLALKLQNKSYEGEINVEGFRLVFRVRHDKQVSRRDSVRKNIYECSYYHQPAFLCK